MSEQQIILILALSIGAGSISLFWEWLISEKGPFYFLTRFFHGWTYDAVKGPDEKLVLSGFRGILQKYLLDNPISTTLIFSSIFSASMWIIGLVNGWEALFVVIIAFYFNIIINSIRQLSKK